MSFATDFHRMSQGCYAQQVVDSVRAIVGRNDLHRKVSSMDGRYSTVGVGDRRELVRASRKSGLTLFFVNLRVKQKNRTEQSVCLL